MTSLNSNNKPVRKQGLPWQVLEGLAVIVDPAGQKAHELDEVGTFLWNLCDGEHSVDDLCSELCTQFDVTESVALTDINQFIGDLHQQGLM